MPRNRQSFTYRRIFRILPLIFVALFLCVATTTAEPPKPLLVYFIDVEGGQSTLFVTPTGESLLIDTGWDGFDGRDADRIVAAAKDAGLKKIDNVLITHYHSDHVGGVAQLAAKIPIGGFIDRGQTSAPQDAGAVAPWNAFQKLLADKKFQRIVVEPGDVLPLHGAQFTIVNGGGKGLDNPLPGAGQENANCTSTPLPPADDSDNQFSLGLVMNFGKLRLVDLGDLPWTQELRLMCPVNKLGHADIYVATHHGIYYSGSPALVHGIAPRVAFIENSAKKGGSASALDIIHSSPSIAATYQLHWSEDGGSSHNSPELFLANLAGPDEGNYLKLTAIPDGSFDVYNSRTAKSDHYPPQR